MSTEPWGSPLDRAGEALVLHDTKLDPAMGKIAWRTVHPSVRAAYIERARVVLDAYGVENAFNEAAKGFQRERNEAIRERDEAREELECRDV